MRASRASVTIVAAVLTPLLASTVALGQPAASDPAPPPVAADAAAGEAATDAAKQREAPPQGSDAEVGDGAESAPAAPSQGESAAPPPYPPPPYPPPPYPPPPYPPPPYPPATASPPPAELPPVVEAPPPATARVVTASDDDPRRDQAEPAESEGDEDRGVPPRLPWRGTAFAWSHSITTTALGVGQSAIGRDHEQYVQSYAWIVNYYLVDYEKLKLRVAVAPSFDVEMTNSDTTTSVREPQLNDLPVSFVVSTPLYSKKGSLWTTGLLGNLTTIFPLSEQSQGTGRLLVTSPRLLLFQTMPLFGEDSPVLQAMSIGVSARWDHTFSKSEFPVNGAIQRPRGDFSGNSFTDDNLSGNPLAHDSLRFGAFVFLSEEVFGKPLWITTGFVFVNDYIYSVDEDYCHIVGGECVVPIGLEDPTNVRSRSGVSISFQYFPIPEIAVGVGYTNVNNHIAPDGSIRNPIYSPDAVFTASLGFSIDALYERITGPKRSSPFLLVGKNQQRRRAPAALTF